MTKYARCAVLAAVLVLALALPAAAFFTDVYDGDLNTIVSQVSQPSLLTITEDYNETVLVPYPSHDGWAIVNPQLQFFDKRGTSEYSHLRFIVENTGPYTWSDYHFEFWNPTFTNPVFPLLTGGWSSSIFNHSSYVGNVLSFWADGWQSPSQINTFDLYFDAPLGVEIGIRQVATTPVPPAVWLFGSGLLGLAGWGYRRRKH